MRTQLTTFTLITLLVGDSLAQEQASLKDEADRINYTIGQQIGADFKKQQVQLDQESLKQGMDDGNQKKQPRLDPKEMQQRLGELKRNITKDMEAEAMERMQKKQAQIKNKRREGREFLATNLSMEGVNSTPSGLQYKVITPGSGLIPKDTDQVSIKYRARRLNGQEFDSSDKKGGPTSEIRVGKLIPGFSEALQLMQLGAKWEIYLPPELAYGRKGPLGHETIIIEVELLEILKSDTEQAKDKAVSKEQ